MSLPVRALGGRSLQRQRRDIDSLGTIEWWRAQPQEIVKLTTEAPPDIIEFVVSDAYLNRPNLYPRQATLLKLITLQTELLTEYDYEVIGEWAAGFWIPERADAPADHYEGKIGIQPDILDRVETLRRCPCGHDRGWHNLDHFCRAPQCECRNYTGSKWFSLVDFVGGRRGSKGHTGAMVGAFVLWNYHCIFDPQDYYGVDRDKKLSCQVFAGKKEQARDNQWRDIVNMVRGSNCFRRYEGKSLTDYYSIYSRSDIHRILNGEDSLTTMDLATFTIEPKEATIMASRGPASFMQYYDEFAHIVRGVARVDGAELEDSAKPALDQFKQDSFMWQGSSPWTQQGRFYENYLQALEIDPVTKAPIYPDRLMIQLASWDPYVDWERAHEIDRHPDLVVHEKHTPVCDVEDESGERITVRLPSRWVERNGRRAEKFQKLKGAVQEFNDKLRLEEKSNPETFRVERRAQWATALDTYLAETAVASLWAPWRGQVLSMKKNGALAVMYRAHGDPSKSGANFGFAMGHREGPDEKGYYHVVFDVINHWSPQDFPRPNPRYVGDDSEPEVVYEIDYDQIALAMEGYIRGFSPEELTFDQFNSVATIQRLQRFAQQAQLPRRVQVYERPATAPLNWKTYETFKTALGMELVHAPFYEQANAELLFLQKSATNKVDHPTSGPVQTKDVADCLAIVTYELIGEQMSMLIHEALSSLSLQATASGGMPTPTQQLVAEPGPPSSFDPNAFKTRPYQPGMPRHRGGRHGRPRR